MVKHCEHCGIVIYSYSKGLCTNCYYTRVQWRGHKLTVCKDCGVTAQQAGYGLCRKCYAKKYYKEYHANYERKRRKEKREHVNALDRARNKTAKRIEWRRKYLQTYYAANRESILEYQRNYRRADRERNNNYKRRRRARVQNLADTLTVEQWHDILKAHNHSCAYCGKRKVKLEREHKTPASRGGGYTADNIVPACGTCNRRKKTMTDSEFREYLAKFPR